MIQTGKTNFILSIAEKILRERFVKKKITEDAIENHEKIHQSFLVHDNVKKFYARLFKSEMNRIIIDVVLESLSDEKRRFIELKYNKKKQMVAISFDLNVSVSQLMIWQREILEKISEFMQYKLGPKDIFQRTKIIGMINILSKMNDMFLSIDPDCQLTRKDWLKIIRYRKTNYENLLKELDGISAIEKPSLANRVILTRLEYPNEPLIEIAERCSTDRSFVSRTLNSFIEKNAKKYIT